jgi:peptidoglycan/LPS O-acetylase OafA/YrhL
MKRIPSLDGFRAISIILVLLCHCVIAKGFPASLKPFARYGDVGVTVFFVISGFLITYLLLTELENNSKINLKDFYLRRAFRILPVFLLYTVFVVTWKNFENVTVTLNNILHIITFTVNFDADRGWFTGHFWSLSVEEQFYLVLPAMLIFLRKKIIPVIVCSLIYSCLIRVISYKFASLDNYLLAPFFTYSDALFIGVLAGIYYQKNPEIINRRVFCSTWLHLAAVTLIAFFKYASGTGHFGIISLPFGNTIISLCIIFLIISGINPGNKAMYKVLNSKFFIHIGILSYSIYIWQQFFFVGEFIPFWRTFPFNLLFIYLVSLASYRLWERPFLNLKNRLKPIK